MSKNLYRLSGAIAVLVALSIIPAGCAPAQGTKGEERSITIVIPEDPPSFNAAIADSGYDALVMHMTLLGMAGIDPDGKVYPELAAELPTAENGGLVVDENAGTMDVTWKMRTDVTWADGTPVTADDVLFTYEAITDPNTGFWIPGIDLVSGVDKIDDHTFVVHFSGIYPSYLTLFGNRQVVIWPAHYCKAEQAFQNWDCGREPLSDGPYKLEEWVTGDHLTFIRNPDYYQPGKPEIDKVIVRIVPDATVREMMMRQGDADLLMWATEQVADNLKNEGNVKISMSPTEAYDDLGPTLILWLRLVIEQQARKRKVKQTGSTLAEWLHTSRQTIVRYKRMLFRLGCLKLDRSHKVQKLSVNFFQRIRFLK